MSPRGERGNGSPPPETLLALAGGTDSSSPPTTLPYEGLKRNSHLILHAVAYPTGGTVPPLPPLRCSSDLSLTHSFNRPRLPYVVVAMPKGRHKNRGPKTPDCRALFLRMDQGDHVGNATSYRPAPRLCPDPTAALVVAPAPRTGLTPRLHNSLQLRCSRGWGKLTPDWGPYWPQRLSRHPYVRTGHTGLTLGFTKPAHNTDLDKCLGHYAKGLQNGW